MNLRDWDVVVADFGEYWYVYLSMPVIAAAIGYGTKIVALKMMYWPLEFWGIGPIGWQGVVPRRASKVAATTVNLLTEKILRPEELLDRIDAHDAVRMLREPLESVVEDLAREVADEVRPGLWDSLPAAGRRTIINRVNAEMPTVIEAILAEVKADMNQYVDLQLLAVSTVVENKLKLNNLLSVTARSAMSFIRRSGIYFGVAIGLVQMLAWGFVHTLWIMPVFGLVTGLVSDWVALTMVFAPRRPRKIFGKTFHGVIHARRDEISRDYARVMAEELFTPEALFAQILGGPGSDRLFALIQREVLNAVDQQAGPGPLVRVAVGADRYTAIKAHIATRVVQVIPETMHQAQDYAVQTLDIENTILEKMSQLTPDQFESIMRPIFKDDEWLLIAVGGLLGFLVGELQVEMVVHLTR